MIETNSSLTYQQLTEVLKELQLSVLKSSVLGLRSTWVETKRGSSLDETRKKVRSKEIDFFAFLTLAG
ncbi:hypothetical protein TNCV_1132761 [Trichonephila clavipes]|nr:hypothetical protein TNCV_1132761 [Trichonephila clavipes]